MKSTRTRKRIVSAAAFAAMAAPTLLFLGTGTAQAIEPGSASAIIQHGNLNESPLQRNATTITQRPGHVAIHAIPQPVSAPRIWGQFTTPQQIMAD
jgi:hypothetical protein